MDIFFNDPNEIPLPPEEVRIRELKAEPWSGGRLIHVYLEVDPFQKRPNADLFIIDVNGDIAASASIIESMARKMELTMHIAKPKKGTKYKLETKLYYAQINEGNELDHETKPIQRQMVDKKVIYFHIPQEENE